VGTVIMMVAASTGGTESGLASIDVPLSGALLGVEWAARCFFDTTLDFEEFQLSFGSVFVVSNDSRQVIATTTLGGLVIGAAASPIGQAAHYVALPDIPVGMGERLFLHAFGSAGAVGVCRCCLHFDFNLDLPKARRR
jgi:hypothetical protein